MEELQLNSKGVNEKIKAIILDEQEMRKIGFTDYNKEAWYFNKSIKFPKEPRYRGMDISFGVRIPKNGSDIRIDILDEDFCQPYDYQVILESYPQHDIANIVKEQVETWMDYLQSSGVLSGHVEGEYI